MASPINLTKDTAATEFYYFALGGSDLQVKVGQFQAPQVVGSQAVTGVGFEPTALMLFPMTLSTLSGTSHHAPISLGWAGACGHRHDAGSPLLRELGRRRRNRN